MIIEYGRYLRTSSMLRASLNPLRLDFLYLGTELINSVLAAGHYRLIRYENLTLRASVLCN